MITGGTYGDLGALKVTTDKFYRINGRSTQLEGVKSDVVFPNRYSYVDMGEKDQDNPLAWDSITPAFYKPFEGMNNYEYSLSRSKQRIKDNPFITLIKKQQENYIYSLDFKSYKATRQSNKTYSERFKKLGEYESSLEFQWLPEARLEVEVNDDLIIKRKRWQKSLKKDIYISEAIEILKDLSTQLRGNNIIAEVKN
jgi:carboxyl-terminal processing protease